MECHSAKLHQKKRIEKKANDHEELVKYMSNLPRYLQRGKNLQERAFNVGVLDWKHLETWQSKHKQIPSRSNGFSPSSSNTSSFSPTEESSSNSSRGQSCSPSHHTLQSHLNLTKVISSHESNSKEETSESTAANSSVQSSLDKADAKGRTTTPLRRLLKLKTSSSDNSKVVTLDLKGCKTIEIGNPCPAGRRGPSTKRALLQVALKNSVPLFKFAVENEGDIVGATMKRLTSSSTKEKNSWMYTFCTIHEMKKKDKSLSNQGGYLSSIIAQMKVSDVSFSDITSQKSITREFVLFTMDIKQTGQQSADMQQTDELAAIVVKFSHRSTREISMNVILPGGNHGIPRKGQPSSLIERWKSGGLCDCGGWDLGCKLRTLVNHNDTSAGKFELFYQGEDQENKPVLRLCPFKDGILSVEYSSSLKILQAFSICLAVLNIRNQDRFCESVKNTFGENSSLATMLSNVPPLSPVGRV